MPAEEKSVMLRRLLEILVTAITVAFSSGVMPAMSAGKPNMLLVIMDDVGIDQLSAMGYGGVTPPRTPTIDEIAESGIRFRNTWSMPECSNGRMALLTGRYPFRTNVYQAIGQSDLANSQVSPYGVTVARMLKRAGYRNGFFGKYHLGGPENNKAGNGGPGKLGWDYFYGWVAGLPASIDTTAGGVAEAGTYKCGYVPSVDRQVSDEGANTGACYMQRTKSKTSCQEISGDTLGDSPGLACLNLGGILVPNAACQANPPGDLDFHRQNAHYVSPLVINRGTRVSELSIADPRGRNYRSSIEVNAAIKWINASKRGAAPWMATVSFSADHTPLQTPPGHLLSVATRQKLAATLGSSGNLGTDCTNPAVQRILSDAMIEAMDTELGRLLTSTGLARRDNTGQLIYDPERTNTLIVIVGDNGSAGITVQFPFDMLRSKASPYQTGIWVPLMVSGPMVTQSNRDVSHLVSAADVYGLFAEAAGLDPQKASRPNAIDSSPLMPYLRNPQQPAIRTFNYSEGGLNIQKNGAHNGPCVIGRTDDAGGTCSQTPINKGVCEDNGGVWWGKGATDPSVSTAVDECWQVNEQIYGSLADPSTYNSVKVGQAPQIYYTARDARFKFIHSNWKDYDPRMPGDATSYALDELYEVNESKNPADLKLDRDGDALYIKSNGVVTVDERASVDGATESMQALQDYIAELFASQPPCPGDGNGDRVVNVKDVKDYWRTVRTWTGSSTFDFDYNAVTDRNDLQAIMENIPRDCRS
jgi:hypothetical protein